MIYFKLYTVFILLMTEEHISNPKYGLNLGVIAPTIKKNDIFDNIINLIEILRNNRGVILDFFRGAWWYYWKQQLAKLNENIADFEKRKVKLITIATDRVRPLKKLAEKENYEFTIISDSEAKISNEYNVFGKPVDFDTIKSELAIPSTYLINSMGKIVWKYIGTKTDRPTINAIVEAIDIKL